MSNETVILSVDDDAVNQTVIEILLEGSGYRVIQAMDGIEALEVGSGGPDIPDYCPTEELIADPAKIKPWKKKFTDKNILVGALGAHGNTLHPDPAIAAASPRT